MPAVSSRLDNLPPYVFSVIGDRIRQMKLSGIDVFRLDIGNPDLPPPEHVIEALDESARNPKHHGYTGYRGKAEFREAISAYYQAHYDVELDPETEVLPVIGSKEGIINLCLAYIGDGDTVLVPDIGYPAYAMGTILAGGTVHHVPMSAKNNFLVDLSDVASETLDKAKLLWVNYPNNPTGTTAGLDFYSAIADICHQHDILLVSDNPYSDVLFDDNVGYSALQGISDNSHTLEFLSFSKSYNMAGWRLGAAVGSAEAIENLLRIKSNVDSGHFEPIYDAGIAALKTPASWIKQRNAIYQQRRDLILDALPQIGLSAKKSAGSLYIWAKVNEIPAETYINEALEHAHVSIAPGEAYGPGGAGYVRLSVGVPNQRIEAALDNLIKWYRDR